MQDNIVWEKSSKRCSIKIITTTNWKEGKPKDPKIPKYLVKVQDRFIDSEFYCPNDKEIELLFHQWDKESLGLLSEAFKIKESHNLSNLKNPEPRTIEAVLHWKIAISS